MEDLKNYYINVDKVTKDIYNIKQIKINKNELLKDDILKSVYNHIMGIIPKNATIELLANINYHSIIWEFLRINYGDCNAIMNVFKKILCNNIIDPFNYSSKLNHLHAINSLIYLLIIA